MQRRLLLSYLGLTLVLLAALEIPLAINYGDRLRAELASDLVRDGFAIAGFAEETVEGAASADLPGLVTRYAERIGGRVIIVGRDGRVLADSKGGGVNDDFSTRPEIDAALTGDVATGTRRSETLGTDLLYSAVPIASGGKVYGAVRITYSTEQINERWRSYILTLVAIGVVSMAAAALLGVLFARWVSLPLRRLETAASDLGSGRLDARADIGTGPPEVRRLATAFNTMAEQVDDLLEAQEAFVADASHQLRTPLAALRLQIENLQSDLEEADNFATIDREGRRIARANARDDLDATLDETARLSRIVDGLLALARADRSGATDTAVLDAGTVLEERRSAWDAFAAEHGAVVRCEPTELQLLATEDRLAQALDNLIANAIDATPSRSGEVVLRAMRSASVDGAGANGTRSVELHVIDNGPGMNRDERERAFDRFWSGRNGSGRLGGSGLGLAIARKLVRADRGDVELLESPSGGLDAVIRLPSP